ncbi:MAG: MCE family protein, partial [Actinomycetota bacterium]
MITRLVRTQLIVFAVLATVALAFTLVKYVEAPRILGIGHYELSAEFDDTSGLYPRALVTYRGYKVGKVSRLDLNNDGVLVRMTLDSDAKIPKDVTAHINSTSAIGEQYVDLVPESSDGPFLAENAVIPKSQTVQLAQITPTLESLNRLLESVPESETTAVLEETDTAFAGSGAELGTFIDETSTFVQEANQEVTATTELVEALSPLLDTQLHLENQTAAYVNSLSSFTDQLRASDPDVRRLISHAPPAINEADQLVDRLRPTLPPLLRDNATTAFMLRDYIPSLRQLFLQYPLLHARIQGILLPHANDGAVKLDLRANFSGPPRCLVGYIPVGDRRDPADESLANTPAQSHCELERRGPEGVRGARNAPCPTEPGRRGASPAECGLFYRDAPDGESSSTASSS